MFNLKSLIQDHSLFSQLKMQNICILITKIVLQIINPSSHWLYFDIEIQDQSRTFIWEE